MCSRSLLYYILRFQRNTAFLPTPKRRGLLAAFLVTREFLLILFDCKLISISYVLTGKGERVAPKPSFAIQRPGMPLVSDFEVPHHFPPAISLPASTVVSTIVLAALT